MNIMTNLIWHKKNLPSDTFLQEIMIIQAIRLIRHGTEIFWKAGEKRSEKIYLKKLQKNTSALIMNLNRNGI